MRLLTTFTTAVLTRPLNYLQRRFRQSRSGSVLILVVALLVLLALIGTAFISTSRIDRYTAAQHVANTEIDLLVQGVKDVVLSTLSQDLFGNGQYRPISGAVGTYDDDDAPDLTIPTAGNQGQPPTQNDMWLGFRTPTLPNPSAQPTQIQPPVTAGNMPFWPAITGPILSDRFDSPFVSVGTLGSGNGSLTTGSLANRSRSTTYETRHSYGAAPWTAIGPLIPDYLRTLNDPATGQATTFDPPLPVWTLTDPSNSVSYNFVAADADGDGIADSALQKLPIGEVNGLTYFVGIHIVDNNSAVNVNTAMSRMYEFNGAGTASVDSNSDGFADLATGHYRGNVGLLEMLLSYNPPAGGGPPMQLNTAAAEMGQLNKRRFNTGTASLTQEFASGVAGNTTLTTPFDDGDPTQKPPTPNARDDFRYLSLADMLDSQLARRILNPGYNTANRKFQPYDDAASLASRFVLLSREASLSNVETDLRQSLVGSQSFGNGTAAFANGTAIPSVHDAPYTPDQALKWFQDNFRYGTETSNPWNSTLPANQWMPRRALLTCDNPVSNEVQPKVVRATNALPRVGIGTNNVPLPPWGTNPAKTNINTAPFEELWRAYYAVMSENGDDTPYGATTGLSQRMFREDLIMRSPGPLPPVQLTPFRVLMLRAALAAVNTIDMRDSDDDVSSRLISLDAPGSNAPTAMVYGIEKQPYITEVYVNTLSKPSNRQSDLGKFNPKGYVAVELHNPYPTPIVMRNWNVGVIDRRRTGSPTSSGAGNSPFTYPLNIRALSARSSPDALAPPVRSLYDTNSTTANTPLIIPAGGYVVLENLPPVRLQGTNPNTDAQFRPNRARTSAPVTAYVYVANLSEVLEDPTTLNTPPAPNKYGGELVLLRPRRADGTLTASNDPANPYNEIDTATTENLNDMVPVDSFDFSNLTQVDPNDTFFYSWYYVKADSRTGDAAWKFVYPGNYNLAEAVNLRIESPARSRFSDATFELGPNTKLGLEDSFPGNYANPFLGMQINNRGFGGRNPVPRAWVTAPAGWPATSNFYHVGDEVYYLGGNPPQRYRCVADNPGNAAPQGDLVHWIPLGPSVGPYGMFARDADMMQVPFIGAYQLRTSLVPPTTASSNIIEVNPVTMDTTCGGHDGDATDDAQENVGRFAPIMPPVGGGAGTVNDLDPKGDYVTAPAGGSLWRYRWALRLFDYLTTEAPSDDYFPNVDLSPTDLTQPLNLQLFKYTPAQQSGNPFPLAVKNGRATPFDRGIKTSSGVVLRAASGITGTENTVGVDGKININTAPAKVLAMIPWMPSQAPTVDFITYNRASNTVTAGGNGIDDNEELAQLIVDYRDGYNTYAGGPAPNGTPFRTIYDLYRIPGFQLAQQTLLNAAATAGGKISPFDLGDFTTDALPWTVGSQYNLGDRVYTDACFRCTAPIVASNANRPTKANNGAGSFQLISWDGVPNDFEKQFLLVNRVSNLITTHSDTFTVYIIVQGWRGIGTVHPEIVVQRRLAFIADRNSVTATSRSVMTTPVNTN